jgi:hypothetical protein
MIPLVNKKALINAILTENTSLALTETPSILHKIWLKMKIFTMNMAQSKNHNAIALPKITFNLLIEQKLSFIQEKKILCRLRVQS